VVADRGPVLGRMSEHSDVAATLTRMGIDVGRAVVVVIGGAGGMSDDAADGLTDVVRDGVLPAVERHGATVIDGGTDSGVMRLIGRARAAAGATFLLVGVAAEGTVTVPGGQAAQDDAAALEPHHTHVILVPGTQWGDESSWIAKVAGAVAGGEPSVTVLVNGGPIAFDDATRSVADGRSLLVVAGSGRAADAIADARTSGGGERNAVTIAASPFTEIVALDDPAAVAAAVSGALERQEAGR